jgi:hypothetical protein
MKGKRLAVPLVDMGSERGAHMTGLQCALCAARSMKLRNSVLPRAAPWLREEHERCLLDFQG